MMGTKVAIYESGCREERPAAACLAGQGMDLLECDDASCVLEHVVRGHVDVLVYALCGVHLQDVGVLRLIRRAAPEMPLVLLSKDDSLEVRRGLQSFTPFYYAGWPPDPVELREAVLAALMKKVRVRPPQALAP